MFPELDDALVSFAKFLVVLVLVMGMWGRPLITWVLAGLVLALTSFKLQLVFSSVHLTRLFRIQYSRGMIAHWRHLWRAWLRSEQALSLEEN
jgi:hypothetical protein